MSAFTGEITVTQLSGRSGGRGNWRLWRLEEALIYRVGSEDSNRIIMVSKGFITDGPSIPQFMWAVLPVWASWSRAGVLHDYLCCLIAVGYPHREAPDRTAADAIFDEAMGVLEVGRFQRWLLYIGVRTGTLFKVRTTMIDKNEKLKGIIEAAADGI